MQKLHAAHAEYTYGILDLDTETPVRPQMPKGQDGKGGKNDKQRCSFKSGKISRHVIGRLI